MSRGLDHAHESRHQDPREGSKGGARCLSTPTWPRNATWPRDALLAGRKLERTLRAYFEGLHIADLWLPFFCISTNLSRAEPHVHDSGELWRAVAASCSIPGIFPPRLMGRDRFVDGGLMDNLPR